MALPPTTLVAEAVQAVVESCGPAYSAEGDDRTISGKASTLQVPQRGIEAVETHFPAEGARCHIVIKS